MTSRQREYQKEMQRQGRCQICGKPEVVKGYCGEHREKRLRRLQEQRGEAKQDQTCTYCGDPGHNRRTCEKLKEEAEAEAD
jgi:hypothetical protein